MVINKWFARVQKKVWRFKIVSLKKYSNYLGNDIIRAACLSHSNSMFKTSVQGL
jgi:hypothetical protein